MWQLQARELRSRLQFIPARLCHAPGLYTLMKLLKQAYATSGMQLLQTTPGQLLKLPLLLLSIINAYRQPAQLARQFWSIASKMRLLMLPHLFTRGLSLDSMKSPLLLLAPFKCTCVKILRLSICTHQQADSQGGQRAGQDDHGRRQADRQASREVIGVRICTAYTLTSNGPQQVHGMQVRQANFAWHAGRRTSTASSIQAGQ
jgi:hypothetical protein